MDNVIFVKHERPEDTELLDISHPVCMVCLCELTGGLDTFGTIHQPLCREHSWDESAIEKHFQNDELELGKIESCRTCRGSGGMRVKASGVTETQDCWRCNGVGRVKRALCRECDGETEVLHDCGCEHCFRNGERVTCDGCHGRGYVSQRIKAGGALVLLDA